MSRPYNHDLPNDTESDVKRIAARMRILSEDVRERSIKGSPNVVDGRRRFPKPPPPRSLPRFGELWPSPEPRVTIYRAADEPPLHEPGDDCA